MSLQQLLEPRTSQRQLVYVSLLKLKVRFPITKQNSARVEDVDYTPKESYVLMEIKCGSFLLYRLFGEEVIYIFYTGLCLTLRDQSFFETVLSCV